MSKYDIAIIKLKKLYESCSAKQKLDFLFFEEDEHITLGSTDSKLYELISVFQEAIDEANKYGEMMKVQNQTLGVQEMCDILSSKPQKPSTEMFEELGNLIKSKIKKQYEECEQRQKDYRKYGQSISANYEGYEALGYDRSLSIVQEAIDQFYKEKGWLK